MAKVETVIETVTMTDGRIVEFAGKRKMLKTSIIGADDVKVQLDFRNGQTRLYTIPAAMLLKHAAHGAEQKLGDETAGLEDVEDCVLAVDNLIDRLYSNEWGQTRDSSGMAGTSILARALCEAYGKDRETIKTFLAARTHAEKVALRNSEKIKPIITRLESEKADKGVKVDTAALLSGLE